MHSHPNYPPPLLFHKERREGSNEKKGGREGRTKASKETREKKRIVKEKWKQRQGNEYSGKKWGRTRKAEL